MKQYHKIKNGLFVLIFFVFSAITNAENIIPLDSISSQVDKEAVFKGKPNKIDKFIQANKVYPFQAWQNGIEGVVNVSFVVSKDGTLMNATVENSIDPLLDSEAIRVVELMTKWKPALKNKEKVHSRRNVSVSFVMSAEEKEFAQTLRKYGVDDNAPLYVIDNKIVETYVILPDYNLKSLKVLKGEKAIEKYGDRAKNGVVEITTKRGTPPIW